MGAWGNRRNLSASVRGVPEMFLLLALPARAATVHVYETEDLWSALDAAAPGDDVVVHAGVYETQQSTGSWLRNVELDGVDVRAADGESVVIEGDPAGSQNILNLSGEWFTLSGFELRFGSKGIRLFASANATLENLIIHDVGDVGISANDPGASYEAVSFLEIEIYNTGIDGGTGECFYLGCQGDECQVWDSRVERNWCHDTQMGSQGDGIEIKSGSFGNVVQDNVIHDVNYPGITMYGARGRGLNTVNGNVVWNSLTQGIQLVGEAIVKNNIVFATASYGIYSKSSDGQDPFELFVVHNTVVNGSGTCLRANDWASGKDIVVANNAFYCEGGKGVELSGDVGTSTWLQNAVTGTNDAFGGTFDGGSTAIAFEDAEAHDYYPAEGSPMVDAADAAWESGEDFNCLDRDAPHDVGAYQRDHETNPGWIPAEGFKQCTDDPPDTGGHHGDDDGGDYGDGGDDSDPPGGGTGGDEDSMRAGTDSGSSPDPGCRCSSGRASPAWLGVALVSMVRRRRYPALFAAVPPNAAK
jgi:hypothetical protein